MDYIGWMDIDESGELPNNNNKTNHEKQTEANFDLII